MNGRCHKLQEAIVDFFIFTDNTPMLSNLIQISFKAIYKIQVTAIHPFRLMQAQISANSGGSPFLLGFRSVVRGMSISKQINTDIDYSKTIIRHRKLPMKQIRLCQKRESNGGNERKATIINQTYLKGKSQGFCFGGVEQDFQKIAKIRNTGLCNNRQMTECLEENRQSIIQDNSRNIYFGGKNGGVQGSNQMREISQIRRVERGQRLQVAGERVGMQMRQVGQLEKVNKNAVFNQNNETAKGQQIINVQCSRASFKRIHQLTGKIVNFVSNTKNIQQETLINTLYPKHITNTDIPKITNNRPNHKYEEIKYKETKIHNSHKVKKDHKLLTPALLKESQVSSLSNSELRLTIDLLKLNSSFSNVQQHNSSCRYFDEDIGLGVSHNISYKQIEIDQQLDLDVHNPEVNENVHHNLFIDFQRNQGEEKMRSGIKKVYYQKILDQNIIDDQQIDNKIDISKRIQNNLPFVLVLIATLLFLIQTLF